MQRQPKGFTIVELLIAIVVIGILASLVFSSFADAQKQARNAATINAISVYRNAFYLYISDNGEYPDYGGSAACLGEGYPDADGDGDGDCISGGPRPEKDALTNALRPYLQDPQQRPNDNLVLWGDEARHGAFITNNTDQFVDGVVTPRFIQYYLEGEVKCSFGALAGASSYPNMTANNPAGHSGQKNGNTRCIIPMPNL